MNRINVRHTHFSLQTYKYNKLSTLLDILSRTNLTYSFCHLRDELVLVMSLPIT